MISLLVLLTTAYGACPVAVAPVEIHANADDAERAFGTMDEVAFATSSERAFAGLECLDQAAPVPTAAALHRLEALRGFVAVDDARTRRAFTAVHAVDPGYTLPEHLAPTGHPLRETFALALAHDPAPEARLARLRGARLYVDGQVSRTHPTDRPFVLQRESSDGAWQSAYVRDPATLPPWTVPEPGGGKSPRVALLVGAGGLGAASAGVYAYAWTQRARYDDEVTPLEDLDGLRRRTNGATVAAAVLAGAGVATATTALVVRW